MLLNIMENSLKKFLLNYSKTICIIYILATCIIVKYIRDLERKKCECSNYWYREYIKTFSVLFFVIVCVYLYDQKSFLKTVLSSNVLLMILAILKFIAIIYFGCLIIYFIKLKNSDCKCSKDWKRKMFLYPILVFSVTMILMFFLMMKYTIKILLN